MTSYRSRLLAAAILAAVLVSPLCNAQGPKAERLRVAVIGDFGEAGQAEQDVAALVAGWKPDFVITTGDNNYDYGAETTIDKNIGQYYHSFISPYRGRYGSGDTLNRFYPSLGNHDWRANGAAPYLKYFTLPGNGRYYDVAAGIVHLFALDSDPHEPDGVTETSAQALWLKDRLAASTAAWKMVYFHHPPYSSGNSHGSTITMRWPFRTWGASVVLAGHEHHYERLTEDSLLYIVDGAGGKSLYGFGKPIEGSQVRYNADYGALLIEATRDSLMLRYMNRKGTLIDSTVLVKKPPKGMGSNDEGSGSDRLRKSTSQFEVTPLVNPSSRERLSAEAKTRPLPEHSQ